MAKMNSSTLYISFFLFYLILGSMTNFASSFLTTSPLFGNHYSICSEKSSSYVFSEEYKNDNDSVISSIEHKTLLTVDTCIDLHRDLVLHEDAGEGRIVFIDASWWHKGDLDGRKM